MTRRFAGAVFLCCRTSSSIPSYSEASEDPGDREKVVGDSECGDTGEKTGRSSAVEILLELDGCRVRTRSTDTLAL